MNASRSNEPINLCEWERNGVRLFTCGRPGRATFGRQRTPISEETIDLWVSNLPKAETLHIVSLLGQKTDGFSEFSYYPFRSVKESGTKPTFEKWLNRRYNCRFVVHEFPTTDSRGIPSDVLSSLIQYLVQLAAGGAMVILVDSAGAERTARVCEGAGFKRIKIL
jgi:hypothetical protein